MPPQQRAARSPRSANGRAETPPGSAQSQSIATVERALDVLLLFGRSTKSDHGVTEIAVELDLSKAAVHRILTSLRNRGLVDVDERSRRYSLGAAALGLGRAYLDRQDIRAIAAPELAWLSRESHETATLSIRTGDTRMYLDQVVPDQEIRMEVSLGVAYPLHAGSSSKAFLAFLPEPELDAYLVRNTLTALTGETITDERKLRRDLGAARRRGYATSLGERQVGAGSVAAPVRNHLGLPVAVLSVSGPVERFKPEAERCAQLLLQATTRISARLGYSAELIDARP